nr:DNA-binding protein YbiB [uncultured Albidiferax sp.]
MGISQYIKEIGRGKDGARALSRAQAADLFGQVLDGTVTDLEVGGFCLAMRIKGETDAEMAGFLDATYARLTMVPACDRPLVVLPSYNGARKLPVLTPLLALLLAREGLPVLVHGTATESTRISAQNVLLALGIPAQAAIQKIANGEVAYATTELLCPGLKRLLDVRRAVGLRNPAHSLVKLMAPCDGPALVVSSYTHPEYAVSMAATFALMESNALLLRGTEGEVVADARRAPQMTGYLRGQPQLMQEAQSGPLAAVPELPKEIDADSTATYIRDVLAGRKPVPAPIAQQVAHILRLTHHISEPATV